MKKLLIAVLFLTGLASQASEQIYVKKIKTSRHVLLDHMVSISSTTSNDYYTTVNLSVTVIVDNMRSPCGNESVSQFHTTEKIEDGIQINLHEVFKVQPAETVELPDGRVVTIPTACILAIRTNKLNFSVPVHFRKGELSKKIILSTLNDRIINDITIDQNGNASLN